MEPENLTPQPGPERAPAQYGQSIERAPQLPTPERGVEAGAERREPMQGDLTPATPAGFATMLPTPVVDEPSLTTVTSTDDTPIVAGDDDLIEKEWVEKAKKIVAGTRDDPYRLEAAVNKLQRDYLKKRYGRELGDA